MVAILKNAGVYKSPRDMHNKDIPCYFFNMAQRESLKEKKEKKKGKKKIECEYGDECEYGHFVEQIDERIPCFHYPIRKCTREICPYGHFDVPKKRSEAVALTGPDAVVPVIAPHEVSKKDIPCRFFNQSTGCDLGDKCKFGHFDIRKKGSVASGGADGAGDTDRFEQVRCTVYRCGLLIIIIITTTTTTTTTTVEMCWFVLICVLSIYLLSNRSYRS